jgi:hypothetical protein
MNMLMQQLERKLDLTNVQKLIQKYAVSVDDIGISIDGMKGLRLLEALKREKVQVGPYNVTLFEAANRIMTDLVILHGVKCLLETKVFPFDAYTVEFGNENANGFDIQASKNGKLLVGEAFNVAPSFFKTKKASMLKKLRNKRPDADYRIIMVNHDAVAKQYSPQFERGEYYIFVNISTGSAEVVPNTQGDGRHNPY